MVMVAFRMGMLMIVVILVMAVMMFMVMVMVLVVMAVMMLMIMVVVPVCVIMIRRVGGFFLASVYRHLHMRPGNPAFDHFLGSDADPGQSEGVDPVDKCFPVFRQLQQRRGQHIPGSAHAAFKIKRFHKAILLHDPDSFCRDTVLSGIFVLVSDHLLSLTECII